MNGKFDSNDEFNSFNETINIPDNPSNRCMYYLSCVNSVLDLTKIPRIKHLINFTNYNLDLEDKKKLITLCELFSVETLENKVFFETKNLSGSVRNEFMELKSAQIERDINVDTEIFIKGVKRDVLKIMLFRSDWALDNYLNPLRALRNEIKRVEKEQNNLSTICIVS